MNKLSIAAIATLLLAPVATAQWYGYGSHEPDTTLDPISFMRASPPGLAKNLVYFNVYATSGPGLAGANGELVNPNVGALGTNMDPIFSAYFEAVLGVWADCNGDGYIGMLETAVREYDSRLLLDDSVCPSVTGPKTSWPAGAHNYNGWVTELIPIGNSETTIGDDSRIYKDDQAMVWGEPGKPDDGVAPPSESCDGAVRGTYQSTGAFIYYLDCQGRNGYVETFNEADAALGLGLGFGSDPRTSTSPLNQPTFGSEDSQYSNVYLQDCDAEPILTTGDVPVGDDADNIVILRPVPSQPVGDLTSPNVPATLNYTRESIGVLPDAANADGNTSTSNCDFSDDSGQDFYRFLEGNPDVPPNKGKDEAWSNFAFQTGTRGSVPASFYPLATGGSGSGRAGVPTDLGIEALGAMCTASSCVQSGWTGAFIAFFPSTFDTRADLGIVFPEIDPFEPGIPQLEPNPECGELACPEVGAEIAKPPYFTFFAYTGAATAARGLATPGGMGAYGSAQCGDNDSGTHNGWNCDASAWYRRADGSYAPNPGGVGVVARVGQAYNHRDVDCFDGSLGSTGVGTSLTFYGGAPCTRP